MILYSCLLNGIKDIKVKDCKLINIGSKFNYGIKNYSRIKIIKDMKFKFVDQIKEKNWFFLFIQKKMKEFKKEKNNKDSFEELEKCKKNYFFQNYNFSNMIKELFELGRKKISFKILKKFFIIFQKFVEEKIFIIDFSKLKSKQEEK